MAATVRIAKVAFGPSARVRISKVSFFATPGGPNARVRISKVGFVTPSTGTPAKVRITRVGFFTSTGLGTNSLLREFDGTRWQPIDGQLVMFDGADWVPC